ncbi:MAG: Rne/Rng family ribonuclease, partial [Nitrospinota bacterium]|nr:Rne/Rng family ribonuclease [Nitrospinota bacterium]
KVMRILPGMQVAFVNIGLEKAGFLYVGDVDFVDYSDSDDEDNSEDKLPLSNKSEANSHDKPMRNIQPDIPIQDILTEGQEIIVQAAKNPMGTKGARLTSYITIPGSHIVYMPNMDQISVSRRIEDEAERERLIHIIAETAQPGEGFIIRTAGEGKMKEAFEADIRFLRRLWENIKTKSETIPATALLYEDLNLVFRSIRDLFNQDVSRLVIDSKPDHQKCLEFCATFLPHLVDKIEFYEDREPIFDHYGIEMEINRALGRKIWLKSGGSISIDQTEALVAIDVNTGKFVGHDDPEETILKTNLEAVREIVYQLRLRNIGGIIVVDFIDMMREESKEIIWNALTQALKSDRYRTKILKISEIGLVEMTRKRVRGSLTQTLCDPCIYCEGRGTNKSPATVCNEIFRGIQRIAGNNLERKVVSVEVHPSVYDMIFEEESLYFGEMERLYNIEIAVKVNPKLHQEKYHLTMN